jgi:hypothetical protein
MMETSRLGVNCQRPREWCKPGQIGQLKILPELQAEIAISFQPSANALHGFTDR